MNIDPNSLKDHFKYSYDIYEESRKEANEIWDNYHNRQWTSEQKAVLENRGQPVETFNVIKLFTRMMVGYYSTVVNTPVVSPVNYRDVTNATAINDAVQYVMRTNYFRTEGDKVKMSAFIAGLMIVQERVFPTGQKDEFGRPINRIDLEHIPDYEVVLDAASTKDDYEDGRFIHRYKWLTEDQLNTLLGKDTAKELTEYFNHLNIDEAEFTFTYNNEFQGYYNIYNNYLVVHTEIEDDDGKRWSILWSDEKILSKQEITHKEVKFSYRVVKLHTSNRREHYGIFREVLETQKAINQALIKLQLMANTQKIFVEKNAVDDIDDFTEAVNRVNGVIEIKSLKGIKVEQMSKEVLDQYIIIDKGFDRIQRVLSINDSMLGMAFASDSGRKVKLQQNSSIMALQYLTGRIELFYRLLGKDIANLVKQYFVAHQILRITDEATGDRWTQLNAPMMEWSGEVDEQGQPIMDPVIGEVMDPATGEHMQDEVGNFLYAPIPTAETEIAFTDFEVEVEANAYNDQDEKNQLMLETILSGSIGNILMQVNPAGFMQAASLSLKMMKTKHTPEIAGILAQTAQMLGASPEGQQDASEMAQNMLGGGGGGGGQNPKSQDLKLPQNTNEQGAA